MYDKTFKIWKNTTKKPLLCWEFRVFKKHDVTQYSRWSTEYLLRRGWDMTNDFKSHLAARFQERERERECFYLDCGHSKVRQLYSLLRQYILDYPLSHYRRITLTAAAWRSKSNYMPVPNIGWCDNCKQYLPLYQFVFYLLPIQFTVKCTATYYV